MKNAAIPAAKKAAKKTAKKVAAKKATKAPAKKAAKKTAKKAPAKKAVKSKTSKSASTSLPKTVVAANVDIGFGNTLYLRGDAQSLSWSKGVPMDCTDANVWSIAMAGVKESFEYKVLINDIHWSAGPNGVAKPGKTNTTSPSF